jgi:hypothetical protein
MTRVVRTTLAALAPIRSRPRSQAAVEPIARSASAPAAPPVHGGQSLEPLAVQAVQEPPQLKDLLGHLRVRELVWVVGEELVDVGGQGGQPVGRRGGRSVDCVFGSMG